MKFNKHWNLEGEHAFLGASKCSWLNYSSEHLITAWKNERAKQEGTELHELAATLIKKKIKLPKSNKTLNAYVNDAIGYGMYPEVLLYYSDNCFGTADSILYNEKKHFLRIHDLKTGKTKVHKEQLYIYAALFCLEYKIRPSDVDMELRIYQSDDIQVYIPECDEIVPIMDKIIAFDKILSEQKLKENE